MSITKATILSAVNSRLTLKKTEIDDKIVQVIQEICSRVPGILQKESSITVSALDYKDDLPTDYVDWRSLTDSYRKPLEYIKSMDELMAKFNADTTAGTPKFFTIWNAKELFFYPQVVAEITLKLFYCYQDTTADTITMPDVAKEAIIEGVCHQLELERGTLGATTDQQRTHERLYDKQVAILEKRYGRL